ncbi:hypothetical protein DID77_01320 [Candidatus Marinamargulisbacteria bacterium SCGC AG-439-L15]|nr:hypothetical protein DID77_01320 [Candidatus Marinamargulisbacteria bacterium SCGC AG-439-L15]
MKKYVLVLCGVIFYSSVCLGAVKNVSIGGHVLGGVNVIQQKNEDVSGQRTQFDMAANIDISADLSDSLSAQVQFQGSPGSGSLGFPGPGIVVTDLQLQMRLPNYQTDLVLGSFDLPFGQEVPYLSNNANTVSNSFLFNSLMYSALGGTIGTLNTIGVKGVYDAGWSKVTTAIINGTDESSTNLDTGFGGVVGISSDKLLPLTSIGVSYFKSDDNKAGTPTGLSAEVSAWIVDAHILDVYDWSLKTYVSGLEFNDNLDASDDSVMAWMLELKRDYGKWYLSYRVSGWVPEDKDGSGTGFSEAIPNPGFGISQGAISSPLTDQEVMRYQVGLGYSLEENVLLKGEVFMDDYAKETNSESTNVTGFAAFVNVGF